MAILTKQQILDADDLKKEVVPVPEWGGEVIVTTMTGAAKDAYECSIVQFDGGKATQNLNNVRAKLIAASVVDEQNNLLFSDKEVELLGRKSAAALDRVFAVAQRLNAVTQDDLEELAKKS